MAEVVINNKTESIPPESVITFLEGGISPITINASGYKVEIDGKSSNDPDGIIVSYQWEIKIGSGEWEFEKTTSIPFFNKKLVNTEIYFFRLRCIDNRGLQGVSRILEVNFTKIPAITPVAIINNNTSPFTDNEAIGRSYPLYGDKSLAGDEEDSITSYSWEVISADVFTGYRLANPSTANTYITLSGINTLVIELTVTNESNLTSTNQVTLLVTENNL